MKNKLPKFRFMAMSKLLGVLSFGFAFAIVVYAMVEMHISQIYDALPQLIISGVTLAGAYVGFYLTMAKVEHVEEEKTKREKELKALEKRNAAEDVIADKRQEIQNLKDKMNEIISETTHNLLN